MQAPAAGPLQGLRISPTSRRRAAARRSAMPLLSSAMGGEVRNLPGAADLLLLLWLHGGRGGPLAGGRSMNGDKKGITLDLRKPDGRALFELLLPRFDVLVENFRPGTLNNWGLGKERLFALQPKLTVLRVSGFGQTGPYRQRPAFARVAEALSGVHLYLRRTGTHAAAHGLSRGRCGDRIVRRDRHPGRTVPAHAGTRRAGPGDRPEPDRIDVPHAGFPGDRIRPVGRGARAHRQPQRLLCSEQTSFSQSGRYLGDGFRRRARAFSSACAVRWRCPS